MSLTLRRLFALPAARPEEPCEARIASIHFEDLATRTVVLAARRFATLPVGSHLWVVVGNQARRLPVTRDERGRVVVRITVTRGDDFADALAFRTRKGDRVQLGTLRPETAQRG